jgi:hypothetical protein
VDEKRLNGLPLLCHKPESPGPSFPASGASGAESKRRTRGFPLINLHAEWRQRIDARHEGPATAVPALFRPRAEMNDLPGAASG